MHLQLVGVTLDQVAERVVVAGPARAIRSVVSVSIGMRPRFSSFPPGAFGSLNGKDAAGPANWAALRRPIRAGRWHLPG